MICFSDHSVTAERGGCFSASGLVTVAGGLQKPMSCLQPGDAVLALSESGKVVFSRILLFLHRDTNSRSTFLILRTGDGQELALTPNHLIFVDQSHELHHHTYHARFASRVRSGDYVLVSGTDGGLRPSKIVSISMEERPGVYAPMTEHGNLFVDGVLASSYASVEDHRLAHWAFGPLRFFFGLAQLFMVRNPQTEDKQCGAIFPTVCPTCPTPSKRHMNVMHNGLSVVCSTTSSSCLNEHTFTHCFDYVDGTKIRVHWYARLLRAVAGMILNPQMFYEYQDSR